MTDLKMNVKVKPLADSPDYEGFSRGVLNHWPTQGIDGDDLWDLAVQHKMVIEIPGGYNPDEHIDSEGMAPETGDPWFEYNFWPPAQTSDNGRIVELQAENERLKASLEVARNAQIERGDVFSDTNPEARWIEDMENACPACGGSGHKDDAALAGEREEK